MEELIFFIVFILTVLLLVYVYHLSNNQAASTATQSKNQLRHTSNPSHPTSDRVNESTRRRKTVINRSETLSRSAVLKPLKISELNNLQLGTDAANSSSVCVSEVLLSEPSISNNFYISDKPVASKSQQDARKSRSLSDSTDHQPELSEHSLQITAESDTYKSQLIQPREMVLSANSEDTTIPPESLDLVSDSISLKHNTSSPSTTTQSEGSIGSMTSLTLVPGASITNSSFTAQQQLQNYDVSSREKLEHSNGTSTNSLDGTSSDSFSRKSLSDASYSKDRSKLASSCRDSSSRSESSLISSGRKLTSYDSTSLASSKSAKVLSSSISAPSTSWDSNGKTLMLYADDTTLPLRSANSGDFTQHAHGIDEQLCSEAVVIEPFDENIKPTSAHSDSSMHVVDVPMPEQYSLSNTPYAKSNETPVSAPIEIEPLLFEKAFNVLQPILHKNDETISFLDGVYHSGDTLQTVSQERCHFLKEALFSIGPDATQISQ